MKTTNSYTETLVSSVNEAKEAVSEKLYREWLKEPNPIIREDLWHKATALNDLTYSMINTIRKTK